MGLPFVANDVFLLFTFILMSSDAGPEDDMG